jgi:protein SCO1/2
MPNRNILFIIIITFFGCSQGGSSKEENTPLPYYSTPDFTPIWPEGNNPTDTFHTISPFEFVNQNGAIVNNATFDDKIFIVNFMFTSCPSICPKMTRNLKKVQDVFQSETDILILSHTVTPWIDSIPVLRHYADNYEMIDDKWHFVTGSKGAIYDIGRKAYFVEEAPGFQKDSTEFLHTEHIVLVDRNAHLRGIYNGTLELEMDRLIEDIQVLKKEI